MTGRDQSVTGRGQSVAGRGQSVTRPVIDVGDFLSFVDDALAGLVEILAELGDERANRRPNLPGANSPFAVVTHCLGVIEYWGGHLVAGRESSRDRAAEFEATGDVAALIARVGQARARLTLDVADLDGFAPPRGSPEPADAELVIGRSQGGALVHILEELAQHRGQLEITRDVLLAAEPAVPGDSGTR